MYEPIAEVISFLALKIVPNHFSAPCSGPPCWEERYECLLSPFSTWVSTERLLAFFHGAPWSSFCMIRGLDCHASACDLPSSQTWGLKALGARHS